MKRFLLLIITTLCLTGCNIELNMNRGNTLERTYLRVERIEQHSVHRELCYYHIYEKGTSKEATHVVVLDTIGRFQVGDNIDVCVIK